MPKKKSKRDNEKYPALKPHLNLKTRYELYDMDYIDQLSEKDKDYLNRFMEEWANANFNHEGKKLDKTKKAKNDSYNRNNARNRCILTKAKASGKLIDLESFRGVSSQLNPEEALVMEEKLREVLSDKKLLKKIKDKKLIEDLKERLLELESMRNEFQNTNNDTSESNQ